MKVLKSSLGFSTVIRNIRYFIYLEEYVTFYEISVRKAGIPHPSHIGKHKKKDVRKLGGIDKLITVIVKSI